MITLAYFINWYLIETPLKIMKGGKNFFRFGFYYFSTIKLLKTFFAPWRRYKWEYGTFDFKKYLNIFASNLVSRGLGAIMRSVLILINIIYELVVLGIGIIVLFSWFLLPFVGLASFLLGIILLI